MLYSCQEVARLISESYDRKLSLRETLGLRFHLLMCKLCTRYQKQIRLLHSIFRMDYDPSLLCCPEDLDRARLPKQTRNRIKELMLNMARQEDPPEDK